MVDALAAMAHADGDRSIASVVRALIVRRLQQWETGGDAAV